MTRSNSVQSVLRILVAATLAVALSGDLRAQSTGGPLRVHPTNRRYLTDGSGKAIYLTGSHAHAAFQDPPPSVFPQTPLDYTHYLNELQRYNHNFIRLWAFEARWSPSAFLRTGPGTAADGQPKFNVTQFNQAYFDRLRSRVIAARDRGLYVSIMLFQGWSVWNFWDSASDYQWPHHPFHRSNNVNGIDGDPSRNEQGEETHSLQIPAITAIQEAYIRKVIDTVNDLDNVLYEISNESGDSSSAWQIQMTNVIHSYEAGKPRQHPAGMTATNGPGTAFWNSPAEWISPGAGNPGGLAYSVDPPATEGSKVVLLDTDHLQNNNYYRGTAGAPAADRVWAWKSFVRGYHPILMDFFDNTLGGTSESARRGMGQTLSYARRVNLASMTPRPDLSSTGYCLASPGSEVIAYQPNSGAFTVTLAAGTYSFEWFNPATGAVASTGSLTATEGFRSFSPPFGGDAVLYLGLTSGGGSSYALTAAPAAVSPGATITASWTAPPGTSQRDWIALYAVGASIGNPVDPTWATRWIYTGGATSGTRTFAAPTTPGNYELRYYLNDGDSLAATSNRVTVGGGGGSYAVTAAPTSVAPGGTLTATWTAPAGTAQRDWIALYAVGASIGNPVDPTWSSGWTYTGGATSGSRSFTAPSTPGTYEFRYYLNDGDTLAATSNPVSVGSGGGDLSGTYRITARHSGKSLSIENASLDNGAKAIQWSYIAHPNQHWRVERVSDEVYRILAVHSGKALDVSGVSTADDARVHQWSYVGAANQHWRFQSVGDGFYLLVATHSGKALSVVNASLSDDAETCQWTDIGTTNQHWSLERVAGAKASAAASPAETGGSGGGRCGATGLELLIVLGVVAVRRRRS